MDNKNKKKEENLNIDTKKDDGEVSLEERIIALEKENESLDNQLKRAVADYRNLERRSSEERVEAVKFANKSLIEALLPAFDTLFLAGKFTEDESVKLTVKRVIEILSENGIEKIDTHGAKYNADTMEAIEVVEGEEGKVVEEVRPGFIINGKLVRPSQVKVGKATSIK